MKALRVKNGQAEVIESRCINCTNCVNICSQGAKEVKNYVEAVNSLLRDNNTDLIVGLAPSFPAFNANLFYQDWEEILLQAGFKEVYEVAWGAQLMIEEYKEYLKNSDGSIISSACPVVVNLVRKYYPELVNNLAPIVSPMGALIKYLETIISTNTKIVLIGPCHAKKAEFADNDLVEGVLTYTEVFNMFTDQFNTFKSEKNHKKNKSEKTSSIIKSSSREIPIAGGLREALITDNDDRYLKVEGSKKLRALFEMMSTGEIEPKFVDALFCDGCINGVDLTEKSHFKKEIAVNQFINKGGILDNSKYRIQIGKEINYSVNFEKDYQMLEEPTQEEVWEILAKTNKFSEDDLLNCGACGYDSCKEKATAVYQGLAEVEMCLPYLLNEKRNEVKDIKNLNLELDSIIDSSYDGMLVIDDELNVERVNSSYLNIVNLDQEELFDIGLNELEERKIIYPSAALLAFKEKRNITIIQNTKDKRLLTTATPVFSDNNKIIRVIVNARDINELDMAVDNKYSSSGEIKLSISRDENQYDDMSHIVCKSEAMKRILNIVEKISNTNSNILISGASGVGKEVVARYIHQLDENREDFVKINCGAIPERLLESELFGYETGAFTGARREGKPGLIEQANQGTLFLDEIGEMPLNMQVKLLQVIQEHRVTRIGGVEQIEVDFRLITATNRNLEKRVQEGDFREDLFYRLNVIPINIPPLNERTQDIMPLFKYYTKVFNKKYDKEVKFNPEVKEELINHEWPGNVREMINLLERLIVTTENSQIVTKDKVKKHLNPKKIKDSDKEIVVNDIVPLKEAVSSVEKEILKLAKKRNKTTYEIADILDVNQSTVVRKMKKYFD
ncbi:MAG: sigma 54-interacting transcriptional regulator [Halanaerobiales bacterium]